MTTEELRESLLAAPKNGYAALTAQQREEMEAYALRYRAFMDACKTEREATAWATEMAEKLGFVPAVPGMEVKPGDTTDKLIFPSADELIATVDSEGCITALAEGQTYITIACGDVQVQYDVVCLFPGVDIKPGEVPTDPPPTDPPVEMTITTNYVNVRAGAGTGYAKVAQLHKGDKVLVYEKTVVSGREWGRVDQGWICLEYAK